MDTRSNRNIRALGLFVTALSLAVSLHLYIFSLPGIGFGFWRQSELAIVMLHGLSGLCGLGLLTALWKKRLLTALLTHWLVLLPIALGTFALLMTPFYELPARNLIGSVHIGEGVIWWFDWALLTAAALLLCRFRLWRRILIGTALLSFAVSYSMTIGHELSLSLFTPYFFPDFHAFHLLCFIPFLGAFLNGRKNLFTDGLTGSFTGSSALRWLGFFVLFNILMYYSNNKAGIIFGTVGLGFFVILWLFLPLRSAIKDRLSKLAIAVIPVLGLSVLLGMAYWPFESGYYNFAEKSATIRNVIARAYLMRAVFDPLLNDPWLLLTGTGWGTFFELITYNLPLEWIDFTKDSHIQWGGMRFDHFHSHNEFLEHLYAGGLVSFALFYTYIYALGARAAHIYRPTSYIFAAGLATVFTFWFVLPLNVPFIALTAGYIAKRNDTALTQNILSNAYVGNALKLFLSFVITAQFFSAALGLHNATISTNYIPERLNANAVQADCALDMDDYGAGGHHIAKMLIGHLGELRYSVSRLKSTQDESEKAEIRGYIEGGIERLNNVFCQTTLYREKYPATIRLHLGRNIVRGEVLTVLNDFTDEKTKTFYAAGWDDELITWLAHYPSRSDQAVPYLQLRLLANDDAAIQRVANIIYTQNPQDPVGLWFKGLVMLNTPRTSQQGLHFMRRALENDVERYLPVEKELKRQLGYSRQ